MPHSRSGKTNGFEQKRAYAFLNRWQWIRLSWIIGILFSGLYLTIVYLLPYVSTDYRIIVPNRFIIELAICIIPLASGLILTGQNLVVVEPIVSIDNEFLVLDSGRQVVLMSCLELVRVSGSVNLDSEKEPFYNTSMLLALQAGAGRNVNFAYEVGVVSGQPFLRFFVTAIGKMIDDAKEILRKEATRIEAILLSTLDNVELHQLRDEKLEKAVSILNNREIIDDALSDRNEILSLKGIPSISPTYDSSQIGRFISTILKQGYSVSFTCVFSGTKPGRERKKLEGEWRSIRNKERNKDDSLADQAIKKNLINRYELIQSDSGWFDSSTYIQISRNGTVNFQVVKEGLKGLILSIWGDNSSITIDEVKIDRRKSRRILTRRHLKSQRIHMSQLAAFVNTPVQPLPVIAALDVPAFPVPANEFIENEFPIGWAIFEGRRLNEVGLRTEWLREHVAVLGATGTGKTTLVRKLIAELSTKTSVPWWVFDVKGSEYSDLVALGDVILLRPGLDSSFVIDLIDTESSSLINQAHATFSILRELLKENNTSDLSPAMEKLLRESVLEMADGLDGTYSVKTLINIIMQKAGNNRSGIMTRDALLNRLEILTREPLGSILRGGPHALKISSLLQKRVVFDLRHVSRVGGMDAARLLYNLVAKRIFDSGMKRGITDGLHHLVVLEEANNLVPESYTRHSAADVTTGESMVMLQRATGQGVIVVSTRPNISSNILANTSTKVAFRLPYDSGVGGRFLSINPEQEQYLRTLRR
ncbi:MAG: ATP-binding protein, partial [Candidatus Thorarchaeota archaeon]